MLPPVSKLDELSATTGATTQGNEASNIPGFTILSSLIPDPGLTPAFAPASPSTKELFKQFMLMYMETIQNKAKLQALLA